MIPVLTVENMRRSDAAACSEGPGGRELMLRAGEGLFSACCWQPPVAVVCGSGNNAGDGFVLALCLQRAAIPCTLFLLSEKTSADGGFYLQQCREAGVEIRTFLPGERFSGFRSIADCIFGTGFHGSPAGPAAEAIRAINQSGAFVVSADINSGLDGDSGMAQLAVQSNLTVAVGGFKPGHFLGLAKDLMRRRVNLDIGIRPVQPVLELLTDADLLPLFAGRKNHAHKGSYGYAALLGGSARYSGAVRLAELANSCMRAGAGVTLLAVPAALAGEIRPLILESTLFPLPDDGAGNYRFSERALAELSARVQVAAAGMGFGVSGDTKRAVRWLLRHFDGTLILDADALTCLAEEGVSLLRQSEARVILTPHLKEFSRLCGKSVSEIEQSPIPIAQEFAKRHGVTLLLKGPTTLVTDGSRTLLSAAGCPGMATAGSGDVLCGVMAAVCGAHPQQPLLAAAAASHLAGRAGELAQRRYSAPAMLAGDTARAVRDVLAALVGPELPEPPLSDQQLPESTIPEPELPAGAEEQGEI